ncbi:MAG: hypothetical protein HZA93_20240 [Verrucomicrobia bacterium]|nr:hypothetical protein [Verrucomicrobiota bacterium]
MSSSSGASVGYSPPTEPLFDVHHWADWVELLCVANIDGAITSQMAAKRARLARDTGEGGGELADDASGSRAEISDEWAVRVEEWFHHLEMRASFLGEAYPFAIAPDRRKLSLRPNFEARHRVYLFLLISSSLRNFKRHQSQLTSAFETIGARGMEKLMPAGAEIHVFGASAHRTGRFSLPHLWDNLVELERALRGNLLVKKDDYSKHDHGDGGLDLVGWLPSGDSAEGLLVMFGQCACTEDWTRKQFSSSIDKWSSTITLQTDPRNSIFIPLCPRKADGNWHKKQDHSRTTLVIDRFRLLHLLRDLSDSLVALPVFSVVDSILKDKEDAA